MSILRFSYEIAYHCKDYRHAEKVMSDLGITYEHSKADSLGQQWWFFNCKNLPSKLPEFLELVDIPIQKFVGRYIEQWQADLLILGESS